MAPQPVYDQVNRLMRGNLNKFLLARRDRPVEDVVFEIRKDYDTRVSKATVSRWINALGDEPAPTNKGRWPERVPTDDT